METEVNARFNTIHRSLKYALDAHYHFNPCTYTASQQAQISTISHVDNNQHHHHKKHKQFVQTLTDLCASMAEILLPSSLFVVQRIPTTTQSIKSPSISPRSIKSSPCSSPRSIMEEECDVDCGGITASEHIIITCSIKSLSRLKIGGGGKIGCATNTCSVDIKGCRLIAKSIASRLRVFIESSKLNAEKVVLSKISKQHSVEEDSKACKQQSTEISKLSKQSIEASKASNNIGITAECVGVIAAIGIWSKVKQDVSSLSSKPHLLIEICLRCCLTIIDGPPDWNILIATIVCSMMTELAFTRILPKMWISNSCIASNECRYFDTIRSWYKRAKQSEMYFKDEDEDECEEAMELAMQRVLTILHAYDERFECDTTSHSDDAVDEYGKSAQFVYSIVVESLKLKKSDILAILPVMIAYDSVRRVIGSVGGGRDSCVAAAQSYCSSINMTTTIPVLLDAIPSALFLCTMWMEMWFSSQTRNDEETFQFSSPTTEDERNGINNEHTSLLCATALSVMPVFEFVRR